MGTADTTMNARLATSVLPLLLPALLALAGCGNIDEFRDPQVPQNPIGYSDPSGRAPGEPSAPPAQASADVAIGVDEGAYADADPSALTVFRPVLEGHGDWIEDSTYGSVWVPARAEVGADFTPYVTAGYWSYDGGYVWVSDYAWGWVPFHYGRWVFIDGVGWAWIPGRRYAGAWVTWQVGPSGYGYVGWAPLGPSWVWYRGYAVMLVSPPRPRYVYCPSGSLFHRRVHEHVVRGNTGVQVASQMRDYVPAQPSVDGSGRVLANPSVSGASDGRVLASPGVAGPSPRDLGLSEDVVTPVPKDDQGLWRARQAALPRTSDLGSRVALAPNARNTEAPIPREIPFSPRSLEPVARAPQYRGIEPRHIPAPVAAMSPADRGPLPPLSTQAPSYFDHRPSLFTTHPNFGAPPTVRSPGPTMPNTHRTSPPTFAAPGPSLSSGPSFSSGPRFSSSPSISSPGPSFSAPSVTRAPASPVIRSSPPSGGFVGARPSVVSSPGPARGVRR
jgi:hypothetical protein